MKLKNPIREIRKAMTPPCTQCMHSRFKAFNSVTILCDSGAYLDHVERTCCERYDWPEVDWDATYYEEDELLKIADMRKRNPSDNAERRFFMLVEQALGAHR